MKMKKILAVLMALVLVVGCFAACGNKKIVVAEGKSAGEEVMNNESYFADYEKVAVDTMAKALMEVASGTADAAVIDYIMALGSIGPGTDYANLKILDDVSFAPEQYGIAFRKGSDTVYYFNQAITEMQKDGSLKEIATKYNLQDMILGESSFAKPEVTESDWEYIQAKGKLVVGITYFAPMNYKDENGNLTGFETDFAKAVCAKLGIEVEFVEIDWNAKETELASKNIDCIWNGMTITKERAANMAISVPYMQNKQVVVVKAN